ncbi:MAG: GWxTD domain-containing protein, partial [Candidatus Kapaibacterium sp.]
GWRSDRGKVYIMLGSPTSIDRHPYDANNRPYEIWQYYDLNQQYYFSDQYVLGDYRLVSMLPPTGIFLWQRESY